MKENKIINNVISYNSGHYARERLKNIIMADRIGCTPDVITHIKNDITKCISAYVNIDSSDTTIKLSDSVIIARIPVNGIHMKRDKDKNENKTTGHDGRKEIQAD